MKEMRRDYKPDFQELNNIFPVNINEIDQLKRDLNEKDYIYRMLFENHSSVMIVINPQNGRIVEANEAAINYYGYAKEKLLNMNIKDINMLSESQIIKEMGRAEEKRRNYFQFLHRLANNEEREVEVYSFPVKTDRGNLLFSVVYDISDKLKQKLMFDKLLFASPYAVGILDKDQKIININDNFTKLFHYSLEEVEGKYIHLIAPSDSETLIDQNIELVYQGKVVKKEGLRREKYGKLIDVEMLGYPVVYHQAVVGVYIIYIDISDKKSYERQLLLFRKILENNSEGVVITDNDGYIEWINNAFVKITGYNLEDMKKKKTNILGSGIHGKSFYEEMWKQLLCEGKWSGEIWNKNKLGNIYAEWLTINSIKNDFDKTTHYVGIFRDLSNKKRIDRRISELQQNDVLTGLYNREYFLKIMNKDFIYKEEFSIIVIDIQGIKEINDSLGHLIGDKVLIELSRRIVSLTDRDYLISRFDGDEFAISCNKLSSKELKDFAQNLIDKIHKPFNIQNRVLYLKANIGISRFPENGTDGETLIRYANIAMCKARNQIKEKVCFYSREMSEEIERKFYLANYLAGAISNKELAIYYQPIYDIKESHIVGAEALLRWESPILGNVTPDIFIPIAEKTGQIIMIGEWVLKEVCNQISAWKCKGYNPIPISINISVKQLEQIEFAKMVLAILKENNIQSESIELEITESVSSGDVSKIIKNLKILKKSGIKISMDDFGTGFSSLGQLDLFELDKLKIDKIFIDDLNNLSKRQNMVKTIIAMASSLDLVVVAEGIETNEQLLYLRKLGCQLGQGHFFSKALPVEKMEILLE